MSEDDNCRHGKGIDQCDVCTAVDELEQMCRWALRKISQEEEGIYEETRQDIIFELEKIANTFRGVEVKV